MYLADGNRPNHIIIMGRDWLCILKVSIGLIYSIKASNKAEMSNKLAATLKKCNAVLPEGLAM